MIAIETSEVVLQAHGLTLSDVVDVVGKGAFAEISGELRTAHGVTNIKAARQGYALSWEYWWTMRRCMKPFALLFLFILLEKECGFEASFTLRDMNCCKIRRKTEKHDSSACLGRLVKTSDTIGEVITSSVTGNGI